MRMRQLSQREKYIAYGCLVLILGFVVFKGVWIPFQENKDNLASQIQAKKEILEKYSLTIKKSQRLDEQNKDFLTQFKQQGTNEQTMSLFLAEIEKQSAELGLVISDLKPRRVKREELYNRFSVSLSIDSELVNVMSFLYTLQKSPHFFDVDEFVIEKGIQQQNNAVKVHLVLSKALIDQL